MELKQAEEHCIEIKRTTFNRTSMELKLNVAGAISLQGVSTFNRTSMELKPDNGSPYGDGLGTFNRTSMELKLWSTV